MDSVHTFFCFWGLGSSMWHSADHSEYLCRWKGQCDNRNRQLQPRTVLCSIQIDGSWLFPLEVSLGLAVKLGNVHGILSNCFQNGIVMSYSRIPPRFAISLLILIFLLIPFRQSCRIGYNVRDQLQIAHIVAKVVLFQALEVLILSGAHPCPCVHDLVCENRVLSSLLHAVHAPFIRQLVADADCKQPLMYPLLGVTLLRYVSSARC